MLLGTWSRKMNHSAMPRQTSRRRSRPSSFNSSGAPTNGFAVAIRSCIWWPRRAYLKRGTDLTKQHRLRWVVITPGIAILRRRRFLKPYQFDELRQPIALTRMDNLAISVLLALAEPGTFDTVGIARSARILLTKSLRVCHSDHMRQ